jgi:hypothetical protein
VTIMGRGYLIDVSAARANSEFVADLRADCDRFEHAISGVASVVQVSPLQPQGWKALQYRSVAALQMLS